MRALILNDTRREPGLRHLGCQTVMANLLALCAAHGIEVVRTFTAVDAAQHADFHRLLPEADAVLVNGEGTLHHDSPGALHLSQALRLAQRQGKTTALLNALWQDNSAARACLPALDLAHARDARSAARLRADGAPLVLHAPDLSLHHGPPPTLPHASQPPAFNAALLIHDSIRVPMTTRLHAYAACHHLPFRVMQTWAGRPDLGAHPVARARFLAPEDFAASDTVHLGGRFHAACLALKHDTPFLALPSNTHKIEALLDDVGLPAADYLLPDDWESRPPAHWIAHARQAAKRHAGAIRTYRTRVHLDHAAVFARLATLTPVSA